MRWRFFAAARQGLAAPSLPGCSTDDECQPYAVRGLQCSVVYSVSRLKASAIRLVGLDRAVKSQFTLRDRDRGGDVVVFLRAEAAPRYATPLVTSLKSLKSACAAAAVLRSTATTRDLCFTFCTFNLTSNLYTRKH